MNTVLSSPVHIIGGGCSGSYIAKEIAFLGKDRVPELHAWDHDVVEKKNVGPQAYQMHHVGLKKVDALADVVFDTGGIILHSHAERVNAATKLFGTVILCVDSMNACWDIWVGAIRRNPDVRLVIETRLDTSLVLMHVFDPHNESHISEWERFWYPDEESSTQGLSCGTETSEGPVARLCASLCSWQLLRAAAIEAGGSDVLDNQIRAHMKPLKMETYRW